MSWTHSKAKAASTVPRQGEAASWCRKRTGRPRRRRGVGRASSTEGWSMSTPRTVARGTRGPGRCSTSRLRSRRRAPGSRGGEGVVTSDAGEGRAEPVLEPRTVGVGLGLPSVRAELVPADAASVPVDLQQLGQLRTDGPEHPGERARGRRGSSRRSAPRPCWPGWRSDARRGRRRTRPPAGRPRPAARATRGRSGPGCQSVGRARPQWPDRRRPVSGTTPDGLRDRPT